MNNYRIIDNYYQFLVQQENWIALSPFILTGLGITRSLPRTVSNQLTRLYPVPFLHLEVTGFGDGYLNGQSPGEVAGLV